jgi:RNA polymerase sigma-70 factor (ECF subfamily)
MSDKEAALRSDDALMTSIAERDESAFEHLYDQFSHVLYGLCLAILRSHVEAETVLQDVFWELWQRPSKYDARRGTLRTFLLTLTRARAIDRLRANARRNNHEGEFSRGERAHREQAERDFDPAHVAADRERRQMVVDALQDLSDIHQRVLRLAYFEGLTQREIADQLQAPLGSVKTYVRQGLLRLERALLTAERNGIQR